MCLYVQTENQGHFSRSGRGNFRYERGGGVPITCNPHLKSVSKKQEGKIYHEKSQNPHLKSNIQDLISATNTREDKNLARKKQKQPIP